MGELWGCCSQQRGDRSIGSIVFYISFHSRASVSLCEALGPGWFIVLSQHGGKRKLRIDSGPAKRVKVGGHRRHSVSSHQGGDWLFSVTRRRCDHCQGLRIPITLNAACSLSHSVNTKHLPQRENGPQSDKWYKDFRTLWTPMRAGNGIREAA